jgi:OCT family organic cation transporter-like MFS transporter 4/5
LPESPRWLLSKHKREEAFIILQKVAKTNKKELSTQTWNSLLEHQSGEAKKKEESIINLIKSPKLAIMSLILCLNW